MLSLEACCKAHRGISLPFSGENEERWPTSTLSENNPLLKRDRGGEGGGVTQELPFGRAKRNERSGESTMRSCGAGAASWSG